MDFNFTLYSCQTKSLSFNLIHGYFVELSHLALIQAFHSEEYKFL